MMNNDEGRKKMKKFRRIINETNKTMTNEKFSLKLLKLKKWKSQNDKKLVSKKKFPKNFTFPDKWQIQKQNQKKCYLLDIMCIVLRQTTKQKKQQQQQKPLCNIKKFYH